MLSKPDTTARPASQKRTRWGPELPPAQARTETTGEGWHSLPSDLSEPPTKRNAQDAVFAPPDPCASVAVDGEPGSQPPNAACVVAFNDGRIDVLALLKRTTTIIKECKADHRQALACLEELQHTRQPLTGLMVRPNVFTFNSAMSACCNAGAAEEAMRMFERILAAGIKPDKTTYVTALKACRADTAGKGHVFAPQLFDHLLTEGPANHVRTLVQDYNLVMSMPLHVNDTLRYFDHLRRHGPEDGVYPDNVTYSTVISACDKAGRIDDALRVFEHAADKGPRNFAPPDIGTYNAALKACANAGRPAEARDIFRRLEQQGAAQNVWPDIATFDTLMSVCPQDSRQLLGMAFRAGLLQPTLGFDTKNNVLNLREETVLTSDRWPYRKSNVGHALAAAIFVHLHEQGVLNRATRVVVGMGMGTEDKLPATIAQCMRDIGWEPRYPAKRLHTGDTNFGALVGGGPGKPFGEI